MKRITDLYKRISSVGIIRIFSANLINKIVAFIANVLIVKVLTQNEYGIFSSANNTYNIFTLLIGMGTLSGVLLYGSEKRTDEEKISYYKFSLIVSFFFNMALSCAMFLYSIFRTSGVVQSNPYIRMLCFLPILQYYSSFTNTILRCRKDNKKYSLMLNISTISNAVSMIFGGWLFGILGAVLAKYVSTIITCIVGTIFIRETFKRFNQPIKINRLEKNEFLKYSIGIGLSSAISTALYLVDVMLVDIMIEDSIVLAQYKVATLIPDALIVFPSSIIVAVLPYFAENNNSYLWVKNKFLKVFKLNFIINISITGILVVLASIIIKMFWGIEYIDSAVSFRILCGSFFFLGTFRILSTNLLSVFRKVKDNLFISILSIILDIVLDIILIPFLGGVGAALATLLVSIIASIISVYFLIRSFKSLKEEMNTNENT